MVDVEAGVLAEFVDSDVLGLLLLVVLPYSSQQAPARTAALAGDALYVFGVYADSFDFHVGFCLVVVYCFYECKFTNYLSNKEDITAKLANMVILDRLICWLLRIAPTLRL